MASHVTKRVTRSQTKTAPASLDDIVRKKRAQRSHSPAKAATLKQPLPHSTTPYPIPDLLDHSNTRDDSAEDENEEDRIDDEAPLDQSGDDDDDDANSINTEKPSSPPQPSSPRKRSPSKARQRGVEVPSTSSLLSSIVSFLWRMLKLSGLIALLSCVVLLPLLFLTLSSSSPRSASASASSLSAVVAAVAHSTGGVWDGLTWLLSSMSSAHTPSSISSSVHDALLPIQSQLTHSNPLFRHAIATTVHAQLAEHFNPLALHPKQPLVLFVATVGPAASEAQGSVLGQSFASSLASLLYPAAVPSYFLDLSTQEAQPHFDGPHLDAALSSHFRHREDGLVYLGSLASLPHRRDIGRVLQRWMDDSRAVATRAVFVLQAHISEAELKEEGGQGRGQGVKRAVRKRMEDNSSSDDQLVDPMLERIVRNVIVVRAG